MAPRRRKPKPKQKFFKELKDNVVINIWCIVDENIQKDLGAVRVR